MPTPALLKVVKTALLAVVLTTIVLAPAASADAPVRQGWWSATKVGPLAVPPPDVPEDGLLVQGPTNSPSAYAALAYEVLDGAVPDRLVLSVAPDTASNGASVKVCPLREPGFQAAQGGPIADAPEFDCTRSATGKPSDDGSTYTFDISALPAAPTLAIAIVPAGPADRVVFDQPGSDSLIASNPGSSGSFPTVTSGPEDDSTVGVPGGAPRTVPGSSPAFNAPQVPVTPPSVGASVTPPTTELTPGDSGTEQAAPSPEPFGSTTNPAAFQSPIGGEVNLVLAALVLVGAGVSATFWGMAGRERPDEASLTAEATAPA